MDWQNWLLLTVHRSPLIAHCQLPIPCREHLIVCTECATYADLTDSYTSFYVQDRKTNATRLRMQTLPLPASLLSREGLALLHDKSIPRGMNANCSGVATLRKRATPFLWRHGTSCVMADGGVGPSRPRGNAVRQRRFPHQRPLGFRLPASFAS